MHQGTRPALDRLFQPRSVAIVGASGRQGNPFARPLHYLLEYGYEGAILPVNPGYSELLGLPCFPSLEATDVVPDLVLVLVPAAGARDVVEDAARLGAGAVVLFSSGFAEVDEQGRRAQAEISSIARASGIRVVGPNCQGVYYGPSKLTATFTAALGGGLPDPSGVAYVGQSGAIGGSVLDLARERGVGMSAWVSVGNQADLSVAEAALDLVRRDEIEVVALYLETIDDGGTFVDLVETAAALDKKLVVLRSGRTEAGQRAAASHTGALTPPGEAFDAVARRFGVVLVDDVDELLDAAHVLSRFGRGHGRRTVILSSSGGAGAIAADHFAEAGLELPSLPAGLQQQLSSVIPDFGSVENPVDVTAQLFSRGVHAFGDVCGQIATDPEVDQLAVVLTMVTGAAADALALDVAEVVDSTGIPVHLCWLAGEEQTRDARSQLRRLRIPVHNSVSRMAKAAGWVAVTPAEAGRPERHDGPSLDLPESRSGVLSEWQAGELLRSAGVRTPRGVLVTDPGEAADAVTAVGGLAVCKVQSGTILHKSELGLVRLNVDTSDARAVVTKLLEAVEGQDVEGVLVQEQVGPGVELLVGVTSPVPGLPLLLTVGMGGVITELVGDVATDSLPLSRVGIEALLRRLKTAPLLNGYRGRPAYDVDGAVEAIANIARLAQMLGPRLLELEVNPLIVQPLGGGAVAADALVRVQPETSATQSKEQHA